MESRLRQSTLSKPGIASFVEDQSVSKKCAQVPVRETLLGIIPAVFEKHVPHVFRPCDQEDFEGPGPELRAIAVDFRRTAECAEIILLKVK